MILTGLACPFNVPNCYNEVLATGALDKFLKTCRSLPMRPMHMTDIGPIGVWTDFKVGTDGLWVRGELWSLPGIKCVREGRLKQLSICFADTDTFNTVTRKRFECFFEDRDTYFPPRLVEKQETHNAELSEISLVDKGAFPGCTFTFA